MDNIYELIYNPDEMDGVYSISLVNDPAIEVMALKFNKEEKVSNIKLASEDKQILVSPVLIPNQKIYRQDIMGSGEGYVYVTEETIEKLQQNYFKQKFNHNSSIEHQEEQIDGVYIFESWIVEDPENDKSNALGFEKLPKGTWLVSLKLDDVLWSDYIKTGEVKGISIDAFLQPKKIENKIELNKEQMNKSLFKSMFTNALKKVNFEAERKEFKISDELSVFADSLELGQSVYKADGELMVESEFDYEGKVYKVNAEGKIETIEEINADDPQLNFEFSEEEIIEMVEEIKEEVIVDYEAQVADLKGRIAELEAKLAVFEVAEAEAIELSKQKPASQGIRTSLSAQPKPAKGILGAVRSIK